MRPAGERRNGARARAARALSPPKPAGPCRISGADPPPPPLCHAPGTARPPPSGIVPPRPLRGPQPVCPLGWVGLGEGGAQGGRGARFGGAVQPRGRSRVAPVPRPRRTHERAEHSPTPLSLHQPNSPQRPADAVRNVQGHRQPGVQAGVGGEDEGHDGEGRLVLFFLCSSERGERGARPTNAKLFAGSRTRAQGTRTGTTARTGAGFTGLALAVRRRGGGGGGRGAGAGVGPGKRRDSRSERRENERKSLLSLSFHPLVPFSPRGPTFLSLKPPCPRGHGASKKGQEGSEA